MARISYLVRLLPLFVTYFWFDCPLKSLLDVSMSSTGVSGWFLQVEWKSLFCSQDEQWLQHLASSSGITLLYADFGTRTATFHGWSVLFAKVVGVLTLRGDGILWGERRLFARQ